MWRLSEVAGIVKATVSYRLGVGRNFLVFSIPLCYTGLSKRRFYYLTIREVEMEEDTDAKEDLVGLSGLIVELAWTYRDVAASF